MASFSKFSIISYSKNLLPVKYIDIPFLEHILLPERSLASLSRVGTQSLRALSGAFGEAQGPAATGRFRSRRRAEGLSPKGKGHPIRFAQNHPGEGTEREEKARGWYVSDIDLPVSLSTIIQ